MQGVASCCLGLVRKLFEFHVRSYTLEVSYELATCFVCFWNFVFTSWELNYRSITKRCRHNKFGPKKAKVSEQHWVWCIRKCHDLDRSPCSIVRKVISIFGSYVWVKTICTLNGGSEKCVEHFDRERSGEWNRGTWQWPIRAVWRSVGGVDSEGATATENWER